MAGGKSPEELLKKIISIELRMFMTVQTSGPTTCQEQPEAFKLTRKPASMSCLTRHWNHISMTFRRLWRRTGT